MEFKEIQDILKLVNKTDLTEVEIEMDDFKIRIRRKAPESNVIYTSTQAAPVPAAIPATTVAPEPTAPVAPATKEAAKQAPPASEGETGQEKEFFTFRSPMIGTFYRSSSPESGPYVNVGDFIQKGQVVCIVEAMKLFNEIESEVSGKIVKILVEDAQPVEYDHPLFLIDTEA